MLNCNTFNDNTIPDSSCISKMLSNNPTTTNLRQQRQHRRTQSTATPYPTTEVPTLPNVQRLSAHRRGISLDNRRPTSAQEQYRVSNTNTGFSDNQQHTLRETQQQRLACQAQQQQQHRGPFYYNPTNDENYLISPIVTPQRQSFDGGSQRPPFDGGSLLDVYGAPIETQQYAQFSDNINLTRPVTADGNMNSNQFAGNDFYQQESGAITPSAYIDFTQALEGLNDDWNATIKPVSRPVSRPLSRNFASRVPQFDALSAGASSVRQLTPPSANSSSEPHSSGLLSHANVSQATFLPQHTHLTMAPLRSNPVPYPADSKKTTTCPWKKPSSPPAARLQPSPISSRCVNKPNNAPPRITQKCLHQPTSHHLQDRRASLATTSHPTTPSPTHVPSKTHQSCTRNNFTMILSAPALRTQSSAAPNTAANPPQIGITPTAHAPSPSHQS